ncbi:Sodium-dependent phosphate transporter 1 [Quillaja saponaria]|uniref:Sodium-dependent phosphate transporter 1 n=1 Tax=Quillaja saponaria TaxID=32244 RepID=A0AAD7P6Q2_QUISA|nr:Sodium-dependent phosphate transporter 1 [Quillaja saponaria]
MGASESTFSSSQVKRPDDGITTVSKPSEAADPVLERLKSLKITSPILTSPVAEDSLTDILVRKPLSSSIPATANPKVLFELFSMYRDWLEDRALKISKAQEEIQNKIEVVDAFAVKLLQRFNYSVSAMKTTSQHLSAVHSLQVEIGELEGRLTEVIRNCDALCKRVATEGWESLWSSIKPFAVVPADSGISYSSSTQQTIIDRSPPSAELKSD